MSDFSSYAGFADNNLSFQKLTDLALNMGDSSFESNSFSGSFEPFRYFMTIFSLPWKSFHLQLNLSDSCVKDTSSLENFTKSWLSPRNLRTWYLDHPLLIPHWQTFRFEIWNCPRNMNFQNEITLVNTLLLVILCQPWLYNIILYIIMHQLRKAVPG